MNPPKRNRSKKMLELKNIVKEYETADEKVVALKGVSMEFRDDGTCLIDGREAYYNCPNMYAMDTGDRPDELSYTFNILNSSRNVLNLKHEKKNVIYRMTRAEEE